MITLPPVFPQNFDDAWWVILLMYVALAWRLFVVRRILIRYVRLQDAWIEKERSDLAEWHKIYLESGYRAPGTQKVLEATYNGRVSKMNTVIAERNANVEKIQSFLWLILPGR